MSEIEIQAKNAISEYSSLIKWSTVSFVVICLVVVLISFENFGLIKSIARCLLLAIPFSCILSSSSSVLIRKDYEDIVDVICDNLKVSLEDRNCANQFVRYKLATKILSSTLLCSICSILLLVAFV